MLILLFIFLVFVFAFIVGSSRFIDIKFNEVSIDNSIKLLQQYSEYNKENYQERFRNEQLMKTALNLKKDLLEYKYRLGHTSNKQDRKEGYVLHYKLLTTQIKDLEKDVKNVFRTYRAID